MNYQNWTIDQGNFINVLHKKQENIIKLKQWKYICVRLKLKNVIDQFI